jgi:amylosucrase
MHDRDDLSPWLPAGTDPELQARLTARLERLWPVASRALDTLYGARADWPVVRDLILDVLARKATERPVDLIALDAAREAEPDWFQQPTLVGYSTYVDRFGGTLAGVAARIGYLKELGVRALHLLPVMKVGAGPSDGGFAMCSHTEVAPRFGTTAELVALARTLRQEKISLCLDLLCNHTSSAHPWAVAAAAGDPRYAGHYLFFDTQEDTQLFAPFVGEVFPQTAPGNFSRDPVSGKWVWTTFYPYQWDLNYANPLVFADMLAVMLDLANLGAETLRLDSVAYMWKRAGTACRNLPEVHDLLAAFRALIGIAAPALLLKAEAIVETAQTTAYLGRAEGPPECQLAYNNSLMVSLWSGLADGAAGEVADLLSRLPAKPPMTSWVNYVRCHDDIGWMLLAKDRGGEGAKRAVFLSDFYAGDVPGSFARGSRFQASPGAAAHGGVGGTAALVGLEAARAGDDPAETDLAIARLLLLHALICACPGTPTLWMGDEIGLGNARGLPPGTWAAEDARALNRPFMDWTAAAHRNDPASVEGRVFQGLARLLQARATLPAFHAAHPVERRDTPHPAVLTFARSGGAVQVVANLSAVRVELPGLPADAGPDGLVDVLSGQRHEASDSLTLEPYACLWLVPAGQDRP